MIMLGCGLDIYCTGQEIKTAQLKASGTFRDQLLDNGAGTQGRPASVVPETQRGAPWGSGQLVPKVGLSRSTETARCNINL